MDFAETINQLCAHLRDVHWSLVGLTAETPDLSRFEEQETDMSLLPVEYVKQTGNADLGHLGEIYFPTAYSNGAGGKVLIHVRFHD